jgi:alpha-beta hydrolase superfamily lysophospholipase
MMFVSIGFLFLRQAHKHMYHTDFSWRTGADQLKIYGQVWQPLPGNETHAVIALVHGMGEHSGRYRRFAEILTTKGISVITFDQRGHGKSEGTKGHITHFNQLLDGVDELLERTRLQFKDKPVFLYGHSMGGNVVLNYALKKPHKVKGMIVSAPWLRLAFEPPVFKVKLARLMRNLYPGFTQGSGLKTEHLSRDKDVVKAYEKDRYVHDRISAACFVNLYEAGLYALQHANELKVPSLLMHGSADKITSFEASDDFAQKARVVCDFKSWEGLYHELHNEPEKEEVLQHVADWINNQLGR